MVAAALVLLTLLAGIVGTTFGLIRAENRRIERQTQREIADNASIEALAQKKIADSQKQLAVATPGGAELRLAKGLISQGDTLSLTGRFAEAHPLYTEAYDKLGELKAPLTAAEVGLGVHTIKRPFPC